MTGRPMSLAPVGKGTERLRGINRGHLPPTVREEAVIFLAPPHIDPQERFVWEQIADSVGARMKITTKEDLYMFERLVHYIVACRRLEEWFRTMRKTSAPGEEYAYTSVDEKTGKIIMRPYPQVAALNEATAMVNRLHAHFGLSPATRAKVGVVGDGLNQGDPDKEFG